MAPVASVRSDGDLVHARVRQRERSDVRDTADMTVPVRPAARVLVFDEDDRLFLLRFLDPGKQIPHWATPGGGVQPGESHEGAARRELWEELGVEVVEVGPVVWTRETEFDFARTWLRSAERFYKVSLPAEWVRPGSVSALEQENVTGWRWWELDDLESTDEVVWPSRIGAFARTLLRDGNPAGPVDVGV